jgi:hypothetical protein
MLQNQLMQQGMSLNQSGYQQQQQNQIRMSFQMGANSSYVISQQTNQPFSFGFHQQQ